jgi:hypothetical protein
VYLTRHRWLPFITPGGRDVVAELKWKPLTTDGAQRTRRAIARLESYDGPVFTNVTAADFASFLLDSTVPGITDGTRVTQAAVMNDRILLRTNLRVADLGAENVPLLGGVASKTVTMVMGGTLTVQRPGLGEWVVKEIMVDAIDVPGPAISRITQAFAKRLRRAGTRSESLGFALPTRVADLRVRNDSVTLYKAAR